MSFEPSHVTPRSDSARMLMCRPGEAPCALSADVIDAQHPRRQEAEALIESVYERTFGARIPRHFPFLMVVRDSTGKMLAASGFRPAAGERLFLEQYLTASVEDTLGNAIGQPVSRDSVVEIGSLASVGQGASVYLFASLAAHLQRLGFLYAVATVTRALQRSIDMLGLDVLALGNADPKRLADEGEVWGSYYQRCPRILGGPIASSNALLSSVAAGTDRLCQSLPTDENLKTKVKPS